jgi:thymidylate kinase
VLCIIEGCDGAGKTKLANDLVKEIGPEVTTLLHRGVPISHILDEYELPLYDYIPFEGKSIVCDRWHVGADVYGPLKRNVEIDPVIMWHINAYLLAKGAYLAYTEAPLDLLLARLRHRGETYITEDDIPKIIDLYHQVISTTPLPMQASLDGYHDEKAIMFMAQAAEVGARQCGVYKSYVGPRRPVNLYVGTSETPIAFMPYEGTRAHAIIGRFGLDSKEFPAGFIDCNERLDRAWDSLYNPFVFTLDKLAAESCTLHNVPAERVEAFEKWND